MSTSGTYLSVTRLSPCLFPSLSLFPLPFSLSLSLCSGLSPLRRSLIHHCAPGVPKDSGLGAKEKEAELLAGQQGSGGAGSRAGSIPVEGCSGGVTKLPLTSGRGGISEERPLGGSTKQAFCSPVEIVGACTGCVGATTGDNFYI